MNTASIIKTVLADHAKKASSNDYSAQAYHKDLEVDMPAQKLFFDLTEPELLARIATTNRLAVKTAKQSLVLIGQTGLGLLALKRRLGHGRFMKEVREKTDIEHRTAVNYMRIASNFGNVSNLRGVRDALKFISNAAKNAEPADSREFDGGQMSGAIFQTAKEGRLAIPTVDAEVMGVEPPTPADKVLPAADAAAAEIGDHSDDIQPLVVDDIKAKDCPRLPKPESSEDEPEGPNPWDISRRVVELLNQLEPHSSSPLGDILICLQDRFGITFSRRDQKQKP